VEIVQSTDAAPDFRIVFNKATLAKIASSVLRRDQAVPEPDEAWDVGFGYNFRWRDGEEAPAQPIAA